METESDRIAAAVAKAVLAERRRCREIAGTQLVGDDADERIQGIIDAIDDGEVVE